MPGKCDHETDELPNPRPTHNPRKKKGLKLAFGPLFFSPQQIIIRGLGLILYRKQTTRNPNESNSPKTPYYCPG